MEKLIYITLAVPADDAPTSTQERNVVAKLLATAVGEKARIVEVSDERTVETIAQLVTAFGENKKGLADFLALLTEINTSVPHLKVAFENLTEAIKVLLPDPKN